MHATATGHWKEVLRGLSDRELFDLRDQVADLTALPGWERIVAYIAAGHGAVLRSLTQGSTKSHADQSRALGYLAGLEEAPNVVQAIAQAASQRESKLQQAAVADQQARQEGTP